MRKDSEWEGDGGFKGAKLCRLKDLRDFVNERENWLGMGKGDEIYLLCRGGVRSLTALSWMRWCGFENVRNVVGGVVQCRKEGVGMEEVDVENQCLRK